MDILDMPNKYQISYSLIGWSMSGKVTRKYKELSAKDSNEAIAKLLSDTKGKAFNFIIQEIKDVD